MRVKEKPLHDEAHCCIDDETHSFVQRGTKQKKTRTTQNERHDNESLGMHQHSLSGQGRQSYEQAQGTVFYTSLQLQS